MQSYSRVSKTLVSKEIIFKIYCDFGKWNGFELAVDVNVFASGENPGVRMEPF